MRGRRSPLGLRLAPLAWLAAAPAFAQSGEIVVRVLDAATGGPLPGATVVVRHAEQFVAATAVLTDGVGVARFPVLRAGSGYVVEAQFPGFAARRSADIRVLSNRTETVELYLTAAIEEQVQVTSTSDVIELGVVGSSVRFSDEFIEELPAPGRFYQDILTLAPGVNDEDGDGNPNVHGARSRDFRAEVSGVSNVDPLTGQWLSRVNADSIEELEIIPQGAGVEFGRAQGGFARVVQTQGGNDFAGVAGMLFRSSELDGDGAGTTDRTAPIPDFETLQPSFQLSGPLLHDRVWFRLSHEYIQREEPVNLLGTVAVVRNEQWLHADQLTWQISPRNKLAFQLQVDPLRVEGLGLSSRVPFESARTLERGGTTYSLTWTAPASVRTLYELLAAYQDHAVDLVPTLENPEDGRQDCLRFLGFRTLAATHCENLTNGRESGPHYEDSRDERTRLSVRGQATLYQTLAGQSHRIKLGMSVEDERYARELTRRPDITFEVFYTALGDPVGRAAVQAWMPTVSVAEAEGTSWAGWVEDQWKPRNNLSLTLGLRVDREEITSLGRQPFDPQAEAARYLEFARATGYNFNALTSAQFVVLRNFAAGVFTAPEDVRQVAAQLAAALEVGPGAVRLNDIFQQSLQWTNGRRYQDIVIENTNVSPRLSLAWDPGSDGKTKIAASAGRYFDKTFLAIPLLELEPLETTLSFIAPMLPPSAPPPRFQNTSGSVEMSPFTIRVVDRELRTPYQDEWSLGVEREIAPETTLRLTWLERQFRDQFQDFDLNNVAGQLQNPAWREILVLDNHNASDYQGAVFEVTRRRYHGWQLEGSYTWATAEGEAEDYDLLLGNEQSLRDDERGYLSYDQRHVVKVNAVVRGPGAVDFGTTLRWESGLPYSVVSSDLFPFRLPREYPYFLNNLAPRPRFSYPTGQRNDQRNPSFWTLDVRLAKSFRVGRSAQLLVSVEAFNLLNDDALRLESQTDNLNVGTRRFGRQWQLGARATF